MDQKYDADYFLNGRKSKKSLYQDYRWLPDLTIPMAEAIEQHLGMEPGDTLMDFGCARGYVVKAFLQAGFDAYGVDISEWALKNCDPEVKGRVASEWLKADPDWIMAKDTLEHLPIYAVSKTLQAFAARAKKGVFMVVPLSYTTGEQYAVPEYELDVTHIIRWPLWSWMQEVMAAFDEQWEVSTRYRLAGVKDNYSQFARGNGFITCKRIG